MEKNQFFKPTPLYKEFMILDLIEKDPNITQRRISNILGVAVSMVNAYLEEYDDLGVINRRYQNSKSVTYRITKKGIERKKVLNIRYLEATHNIYLGAKDNIEIFLEQIIDKGYKKILLYGAGEVAEILLQTLYSNKDMQLEVIAIIDDDVLKQNTKLLNTDIICKNSISKYSHDGIMISSYIHRDTIRKKLLEIDYSNEKIIDFFI